MIYGCVEWLLGTVVFTFITRDYNYLHELLTCTQKLHLLSLSGGYVFEFVHLSVCKCS